MYPLGRKLDMRGWGGALWPSDLAQQTAGRHVRSSWLLVQAQRETTGPQCQCWLDAHPHLGCSVHIMGRGMPRRNFVSIALDANESLHPESPSFFLQNKIPFYCWTTLFHTHQTGQTERKIKNPSNFIDRKREKKKRNLFIFGLFNHLIQTNYILIVQLSATELLDARNKMVILLLFLLFYKVFFLF